MTGLSIFNWESTARTQDITKAAQTITSAIDKNTGKLSTDLQRTTDKVTTAVKTGSEKIVDAVGKIKTTHNANLTPPVAAVIDGLFDMSQATADLGQFLINAPDEMAAATDTLYWSVGLRCLTV